MNPNDPVEEFFAKERGAIVPISGDEDRWEQIVERAGQSRRRGRPRLLGYVAAAASVALVAGAGGWLLRGMGADGNSDPLATGLPSLSSPSTPLSPSPTAVATEPTDDAPSAGESASVTPLTSTTTTTTPNHALPLSRTFDAVSMSQAGASTVFALGRGRCGDEVCPVVARSHDNGGAWEQVATLTGADVPGIEDRLAGSGAFTQIRMASEKVGWVFGGGLQQTTDGGLNFRPYEHAGETVVALSTDGANVAIVSATGGCDADGCDGALQVQVAPVGANSATSPAVTIAEGGVVGATVAWWRGRAYVSPQLRDGFGTPVAITAEGQAGALDLGCAARAQPQIVAPGSGDTLFAFCRVPGAGQAEASGTAGDDAGDGAGTGSGAMATYRVRHSTDDGRTWTDGDASRVRLYDAGITSFAAGDADHLVAVSGGNGWMPTSGRVSADGGRTWTNLPVDETDLGWRWVGAPGATWYYLLPVAAGKGFYKATGFGEEWTWQEMSS